MLSNKRVLIACEESQAVTKAFRRLGVPAMSCDILECSGGHPDWHIQGDVTDLLKQEWDLIIAFPPCTDLAVSGARHFKAKQADRTTASLTRSSNPTSLEIPTLRLPVFGCKDFLSWNIPILSLLGSSLHTEKVTGWQHGLAMRLQKTGSVSGVRHSRVLLLRWQNSGVKY